MFSLLLAAATAATPAAKATAAALTIPIQQALQNGIKYQPQTGLQQHAGWLTHTFAGIFIISALLLIVMLAIQTTKQEGLSGTIGGRVESAYRPRLGFDQQLARFTSFVALTFVFFALVCSITGI